MRSGWLALGAGLSGFALTSPGVDPVARLAVLALIASGLTMRRSRVLILAACILGTLGGARVRPPIDLKGVDPSELRSLAVHLTDPVVGGRSRGWVRAEGLGVVRARVTGLDGNGVGAGTRLVGQGLVRDLARRPTPDRRDAARAAAAHGDRVGVRLREWRILDATAPSLRQRWGAQLDERLGASAGFWRALTVADAAGLDPAARGRVQDLGLAHLLALSGMHVAVVAAALLWPWRRHGRGALVWVLPALALWAVVAGSGPSLVRAVGMATWWVVARRLGRRADPEDGLAAMALVEMALRPQLLCGVGWWLSYVATLAVVRGARAVAGWPRLAGAVAVSSLAQVATLPWVLDAFGWVNLAAPVALLVVGPIFAAVLTVGLAALGAGTLLPAIAPWTDALTRAAGHLFGASLAACGPLAELGLRAPGFGGLLWTGALAIVAVMVWPARIAPRYRLVAVALIVPALLWSGRTDHEWIVFDVGQGDGAVYRCGNEVLVIDSGPRYESVAPAEWTVADWLERRGVRGASVVLTHGHLDHTGGLATLLAGGRVADVIVAACDRDRSWAGRVARAAEVTGVGLRFVAAGDRIELGHCMVEVGWPAAAEDAHHGNDRSVVLSFGPSPDRVWSPGDLERTAESRLVPGVPHAWLKVAHHGGDTGTDGPHLGWLRPDHALVSCGAGNRYGHPDPALLARLRAAGATIHRTDQCGFLRVRWPDDGAAGRLDCGRSGCS